MRHKTHTPINSVHYSREMTNCKENFYKASLHTCIVHLIIWRRPIFQILSMKYIRRIEWDGKNGSQKASPSPLLHYYENNKVLYLLFSLVLVKKSAMSWSSYTGLSFSHRERVTFAKHPLNAAVSHSAPMAKPRVFGRYYLIMALFAAHCPTGWNFTKGV